MTKQTQTRVVLNPKHRSKAEEILEATGIETYSQLLSVFIVNFGDLLVTALKSQPNVASVSTVRTSAAGSVMETAVQQQVPVIKPRQQPNSQQSFTPLAGF